MPEPRKLRVFLCHASQDKLVVRELYQKLLAEGWIDPWLDEEKLLPGQDWDLEIEKAVEITDAVIVFLSKNSVNKEGYVQRELKYVLDIALEKPEGSIFIIPIRFDGCNIPRRLRSFHYLEWSSDIDNTLLYGRLINSLKKRSEQQVNSFEESNIKLQEKISALLSAFLKADDETYNEPLVKTYTIKEYTDVIQKLRNSPLEAPDSERLYEIICKIEQLNYEPLMMVYLISEIMDLFYQFQNFPLTEEGRNLKETIINGLYNFRMGGTDVSNDDPQIEELKKRFREWQNQFFPGENK